MYSVPWWPTEALKALSLLPISRNGIGTSTLKEAITRRTPLVKASHGMSQ